MNRSTRMTVWLLQQLGDPRRQHVTVLVAGLAAGQALPGSDRDRACARGSTEIRRSTRAPAPARSRPAGGTRCWRRTGRRRRDRRVSRSNRPRRCRSRAQRPRALAPQTSSAGKVARIVAGSKPARALPEARVTVARESRTIRRCRRCRAAISSSSNGSSGSIGVSGIVRHEILRGSRIPETDALAFGCTGRVRTAACRPDRD